MEDRPITTLFMLMSVDGKISPGASDDLDVDKDFPNITGLKEGLSQYYEINQLSALSHNTVTVMLKNLPIVLKLYFRKHSGNCVQPARWCKSISQIQALCPMVVFKNQ